MDNGYREKRPCRGRTILITLSHNQGCYIMKYTFTNRCLWGVAGIFLFSALPAIAPAQQPTLEFRPPVYALPAYLSAKLSPEDRTLMTRLLNINIESAWGYLRTRGYPRNFINAVQPVHPDMRFAGRART